MLVCVMVIVVYLHVVCCCSDCMNFCFFSLLINVFSNHNWSSGVSLSARRGTFVTTVYSEVVCIVVFFFAFCIVMGCDSVVLLV